MKCSLGISNFLGEIFSLSHSIVPLVLENMTILEIHMHVPSDVAFSCRALVDFLEPIPGRQGSGLKASLEE